MKKTPTQKTLNATTRAKRAFNLVKSGRYKNHIGNAMPAKSRLYKLGQLVTSIDPWKIYNHDLTFVKSLRWPGGGGYLVLDKYGKPHTTTNIRAASKVAAVAKM
jgi:hypothetical protein